MNLDIKKIKEKRVALKLKHWQCAKAIDKTTSVYTKKELGQIPISSQEIAKIADLFGCRPDEFYDLANEGKNLLTKIEGGKSMGIDTTDVRISDLICKAAQVLDSGASVSRMLRSTIEAAYLEIKPENIIDENLSKLEGGMGGEQEANSKK
jgi:hypothetical protein